MLYKGHRSTEWCPRCGTSISQHELTQSGVYQDRSDPSLYVRFPLLDRKGESLVVWTTTPWTLPANVAAAVKADAEYGRRENGEWVAAARYPDESFVETAAGSELVGLRYRGPFDDLPPAARRRAPRDPVGRGLARGGDGHRPHRSRSGAGGLRARPGPRPPRALPRRRGGPLLRLVRMAARPLDDRGRGSDRRPTRGDRLPAPGGHAGASLPALLALRHAAHLARHGRLAHRGRRSAPAAPRRERDRGMDARVHGQAHGRLAPQHGRLEHLAAPLLRAPAADLRVRVRAT